MYFQNLGNRYSFIYYDIRLKKNIRLKKSETPRVLNDSEAHSFCEKWDAIHDAQKRRIEKRIAWQNEFHSFEALLNVYEKIRKEEAPNSYQADRYYLSYYILPFFLEKGLNNMNLWPDEFEEFRDFLLITEPMKMKKGENTLAYSTKNNIIKTLNSFLTIMQRRKQFCDLKKCRYFSKSKINQKTEECVIPSEIQIQIYSNLKTKNPIAAAYFWVSIHTGMRLNELLGISLADFFSGYVKEESLERMIRALDLKAYGFISLESQPSSSVRIKDLAGVVKRKPLKGRKRMDHENSRTIPIFNIEAYNLLAKLWNQRQETFIKLAGNPKDYLLFEGLNKNSYSNALRKAQKGLNIRRPFTPHDCRHTYSTWLAEKTGGNYSICRLILGHGSLEMTLRYVHMNAKIQKNIQLQSNLTQPMQFIDMN